MTREDILQFFATRQAIWLARDPVGLAALHHENGVVDSPIFGTVRGRTAIEQSYRELFNVFHDWTLDGEELIIDRDRVAQTFRAHATHTHDMFGVAATHRRFEIHGVLVFTLHDGLIIAERRMYDFTGMLIQLGVIKPKMK